MKLPFLLLSALNWATLTRALQRETPLSPTSSQPQQHLLLDAETSSSLLALHRNLISIGSISGNEHEVASWLGNYLSQRNWSVELQEVHSQETDSSKKKKKKKRYNVFAHPPGKNWTDVLLTSHIDTVPPFIPYNYNSSSEHISGRGSVDAKASVASQIVALSPELRTELKDEVSLLYVVGEETGGSGMRAFSQHLSDQGREYNVVIFGEPTEGKLVCGHKGILGFDVIVQGKAAHSGYPWLGVSANEVLIRALAKLYQVGIQGGWPSSSKYGNTTLNFGRVEGGVAANVVSESARAKIAMRLAGGDPAEIRALILSSLTEIKKDAEQNGGNLSIEFPNEGYGPVEIDCDIDGFETLTVNYGTDVPFLRGPHRRYLYGPGSILVAHGENEGLGRKELEQAVLDLRRLVVATGLMHHEIEIEIENEGVEL